MYSGLGMNFGHDSDEWTEPGLTNRLTLLYNAGIKKIRVNLPSYQTEASNTSYRDTLRNICETWLAFSSDTYVVWGYTIAGSSPSTLSLTALEGTYHDAFEGMATWVATLTAGEQLRFEMQLGNEDDDKVDGTTLPAADYRTYIRGTLATDVLAIAPTIQVSYSVRNDFLSSWTGGGLGGLTKMGLTLYKSETVFTSRLNTLTNAFGRNCYLTEFGYIDETGGVNYYEGDDEMSNRAAWWQMNECRLRGIDCYFFAWSTPSTTHFSIYPNDVFRNSWYVLTEKRERYIKVTTPR